jgi:hypothetical protein
MNNQISAMITHLVNRADAIKNSSVSVISTILKDRIRL